MQLPVSLFAFVVGVSLISAGRHYNHQGECNHRISYNDNEDNDLDAIPAGGYEVESSQPKATSSSHQIHRQSQQVHHSLYQQDTPFFKTGIKNIRKPFYRTNYKNNAAYGYEQPPQQQNQIIPFKNSNNKGYKNEENEATDEKFSSSSTYSNLWHYLLKSNLKMKLRKKPWLLLPNHGSCYQEFCKSEKDCCRHYNICDKSAQVCIDCWYGYPCSTSAECCERYPVCHRSYGDSHGRCSKK